MVIANKCPAQSQTDIWHCRSNLTLVMCVTIAPSCLMVLTLCFSAEYLIVITGRERRGRLMGQEVYRATDYDILPLNPNISVNYPPHPVEGHLLALVRSHLFGSLLLFSYGWDITTRLQVQWASQEASQRKGLWETVRPQLPTIFAVVYAWLRPMIDSFGTSMHTGSCFEHVLILITDSSSLDL